MNSRCPRCPGALRRALMIAALVLSGGVSLPAVAGPWTKAPGEVYLKVSESYFASDTFVSADGERVAGADYLALSTSLYVEAGLTPRLHIQGFLPWSFTRNEFVDLDTRYANVGLGDAQIGLQTTPVKIKLPYAMRLVAKVPLYDIGDIQGTDAARFPALGDGQVDVTGWLSLGGSLWPRPIYFLGEIGWRRRTEIFWGRGRDLAFEDGMAFSGQAGYTWRERLLMALQVDGIYTFVGDDMTQSFVTVGPLLALAIGRGFSLEGNASAMVWSRNNAPGTSWGIGLSWKR